MKIKGEKTYPARTVVEVVSRVCDLCGCETDSDNEWPRKGNVGCVPGDTRRTGLYCNVGISDRDGGGCQQETSFDVCPECFRDKLIPAMAAMGAKPSVEDRGW